VKKDFQFSIHYQLLKLKVSRRRCSQTKLLTFLNLIFSTASQSNNKENPIKMNKEALKERLTPLQYHVTQEAGTERPFTGKYNKFYEQGTYVCVVCNQDLFSSDTKYDSGCGWPAFNDCLDKGKVTLHADPSLGILFYYIILIEKL
jgi:hypothetical protein